MPCYNKHPGWFPGNGNKNRPIGTLFIEPSPHPCHILYVNPIGMITNSKQPFTFNLQNSWSMFRCHECMPGLFELYLSCALVFYIASHCPTIESVHGPIPFFFARKQRELFLSSFVTQAVLVLSCSFTASLGNQLPGEHWFPFWHCYIHHI